MKKYDICLQCGNFEQSARAIHAFGQALEKRGWSVFYWCDTWESGAYFRDHAVDHFVVVEELRQPVRPDDDGVREQAIGFLRANGFPNLRFFYFTDAAISQSFAFSDFWLAETISRALAIKKFTEQGISFKYAFTFGGDEIYHNTLKLAANSVGAQMIYYTFPFTMDRLAFTTNPKGIWRAGTNQEVSDFDTAMDSVERYIAERISQKPVVGVKDVREYDVQINLARIMRKFISNPPSLRKRDRDPRNDFLHNARTRLRRIMRRQTAYLYYDNPAALTDAEYFYFPLHFPADSQLTLRARPFLSQDFLVETVARYLPYPHKLVVKEHPHARGYMPSGSLWRIKKQPNVVLLHPDHNSHDIIQNAKAVVVINSTVGFEAILHKKPVITIGDSYFRGLGVTLDVGHLSDLEDLIGKALSWKLTDAQIREFLLRLYRASYPISARELIQSQPVDVEKLTDCLLDFIHNNFSSDLEMTNQPNGHLQE